MNNLGWLLGIMSQLVMELHGSDDDNSRSDGGSANVMECGEYYCMATKYYIEHSQTMLTTA